MGLNRDSFPGRARGPPSSRFHPKGSGDPPPGFPIKGWPSMRNGISSRNCSPRALWLPFPGRLWTTRAERSPLPPRGTAPSLPRMGADPHDRAPHAGLAPKGFARDSRAPPGPRPRVIAGLHGSRAQFSRSSHGCGRGEGRTLGKRDPWLRPEILARARLAVLEEMDPIVAPRRVEPERPPSGPTSGLWATPIRGRSQARRSLYQHPGGDAACPGRSF